MNDIMKNVQALEDSNVLLKGVTKQLKMKQKNKQEDFQVSCQVLQEQVCQEIYYQEKEKEL